MKKSYLIAFLLCFFIIESKGQNYNALVADTFYYPFSKGIQMIEIAYIEPFIKDNFYRLAYHNTYINTEAAYHNIYIFRDSIGNILNSFGSKDNYTLRSIEESFISEDFLLYQYNITAYIDQEKQDSIYAFAFTDENGKRGLINQYGEILISPHYMGFHRANEDLIVALDYYFTTLGNTFSIFFLNEPNKNSTTKNLSLLHSSQTIPNTIFFNNCILDTKRKKIFFMNIDFLRCGTPTQNGVISFEFETSSTSTSIICNLKFFTIDFNISTWENIYEKYDFMPTRNLHR